MTPAALQRTADVRLYRGMPPRRFPPPWPPRKPDACFIVREATGKELGHFYFEYEPRTPCGGQAAHPRRGPAHRRPTLLKPRELNTRRFPV